MRCWALAEAPGKKTTKIIRNTKFGRKNRGATSVMGNVTLTSNCYWRVKEIYTKGNVPEVMWQTKLDAWIPISRGKSCSKRKRKMRSVAGANVLTGRFAKGESQSLALGAFSIRC